MAAAFTNDTAEKTGRSSRDVRRDARRGSSIAPEVMEKVKADPKLNKGVVLDELAKTRKLNHEARCLDQPPISVRLTVVAAQVAGWALSSASM